MCESYNTSSVAGSVQKMALDELDKRECRGPDESNTRICETPKQELRLEDDVLEKGSTAEGPSSSVGSLPVENTPVIRVKEEPQDYDLEAIPINHGTYLKEEISLDDDVRLSSESSQDEFDNSMCSFTSQGMQCSPPLASQNIWRGGMQCSPPLAQNIWKRGMQCSPPLAQNIWKGGMQCSPPPAQNIWRGFSVKDNYGLADAAQQSFAHQMFVNQKSLDYHKSPSSTFRQQQSNCDEEENDSFGQHFLTQFSVKDNHVLADAAQESFTYQVFIKEEPSDEHKSPSSTSKQQSNCDDENDTFGQHFLTQCLEPPEPCYQYTNGQSAELECPFPVDMTLQSLHTELQDSSRNSEFTQMDKNGISGQPGAYNSLVQYKSSRMGAIENFTVTNQLEVLNSKLFACQYCKYKTTIKGCLKSHVIRRHNFGNTVIDCPYCKFQSLSIMEVEDHIANKHNKPKVYIPCPYTGCDFKHIGQSGLRYHIAAKHTRQMNFSCPFCGYKSILVYSMQRHIFTIHNKKVNRNCPTIRISS